MTFFECYKRELEECGWWIKDEEKFKKKVDLSKAFDNYWNKFEPEKYNKSIKDYTWDSKMEQQFIARDKSLIHKNFKELFVEAPETIEDDKIICPHCKFEEYELCDVYDDDSEWNCPDCGKKSFLSIEIVRVFTAIGRKPLESNFNEAEELY